MSNTWLQISYATNPEPRQHVFSLCSSSSRTRNIKKRGNSSCFKNLRHVRQQNSGRMSFSVWNMFFLLSPFWTNKRTSVSCIAHDCPHFHISLYFRHITRSWTLLHYSALNAFLQLFLCGWKITNLPLVLHTSKCIRQHLWNAVACSIFQLQPFLPPPRCPCFPLPSPVSHRLVCISSLCPHMDFHLCDSLQNRIFCCSFSQLLKAKKWFKGKITANFFLSWITFTTFVPSSYIFSWKWL